MDDWLFRVRCWLIDILAGQDTIVCNADLGGAALLNLTHDRRAFVNGGTQFNDQSAPIEGRAQRPNISGLTT